MHVCLSLQGDASCLTEFIVRLTGLSDPVAQFSRHGVASAHAQNVSQCHLIGCCLFPFYYVSRCNRTKDIVARVMTLYSQ